jgi:hypothetical protein
VGPHPRPITLAEHGARVTPVFLRAFVPRLPFLARGAGIRGNASAWAATICPPMGHRASTFEEKPNNMCE